MGIAIQLEILLEPVTLVAHYQETHLCVQVSKNDSVGLVYYRYKCIKLKKKYFNVVDHFRTTTHIIKRFQTEYIFLHYRLVCSLFTYVR